MSDSQDERERVSCWRVGRNRRSQRDSSFKIPDLAREMAAIPIQNSPNAKAIRPAREYSSPCKNVAKGLCA
jgi:hypothetical protein